MEDEQQLELIDQKERQLLDKLLQDSRLYTRSADYKAMLDFVAKLRHFAPFNAMLLQVQKKGLTYAASERDWLERFGRTVKEDARPLLIMWPMGPVALVYDVLDTEGRELPKDAETFYARGPVTRAELERYYDLLGRKRIMVHEVDEGDASAGRIMRLERVRSEKEYSPYRVVVNRNHQPATQFATLVHELGHLFLGHLGKDPKLRIPERPRPTHAEVELEAESVSYLVCKRQGIESRSEVYLSDYVATSTTVDHIGIYQVMKAAGRVEDLLGLAVRSQF
jgi:hypothetical protein